MLEETKAFTTDNFEFADNQEQYEVVLDLYEASL